MIFIALLAMLSFVAALACAFLWVVLQCARFIIWIVRIIIGWKKE